MKIGSYNVENLFLRARALNQMRHVAAYLFKKKTVEN